MTRKIRKIYLVSQIAFAILVILFGATYSLRCLFAGQIFCTVCFALMAYVCGYRLTLRTSIKELRDFSAEEIRPRA